MISCRWIAAEYCSGLFELLVFTHSLIVAERRTCIGFLYARSFAWEALG